VQEALEARAEQRRPQAEPARRQPELALALVQDAQPEPDLVLELVP
jgi:tRNA G10  N-methylase Trm11